MSNENLVNLTKDTLYLLKEYAFEAKRKSVAEATDFSFGYLAGFHRAISLFQKQADSFGIQLDVINLNDIDPDKDLV